MKSLITVVCIVSTLSTSAFAASKECWLDITYTGHQPKTIAIDLVKEVGDEANFQKISGSLFIEIVTKGENQTIINVKESATGVEVTANGNILSIKRDMYNATIMCNEESN